MSRAPIYCGLPDCGLNRGRPHCPTCDEARALAPTREGIWRDHTCYRCRNGERFCVQGDARQCEYPHAKNG